MASLVASRRADQLPHQSGALIDKLPNEIILQCLFLLEAQVLTRYRQVCRHWRELIDTDTALQYKIELWANDMIDGPPSEIGIEERLRRLREYQKRWENRQFSCDSSVEFDQRDATWLIEAASTDGSVAYRVRGDNFLDLVVVSPPAALRHVDQRMWTIPLRNIPGKILPIAIDVEQDLVLVTACPPASR
ncbi:hypothetical protein GY45DRAFT_685656 [Cubamyces sp. BRFM 1775]|nr:hypothetical protein GY45DRAFT_685656 [Cubamyces sp. BRFM 1775]